MLFFENQTNYKKIAKWIIGIVASCILIYLGMRYIHTIGSCIRWFVELVLPILLGIVLALILNIPLHFFEHHLLTKCIKIRSLRVKRNIGIFLSILCILSVVGFAFFLVVPELVQAIITLVNIGTDSITIISELTETIDYSSLPFGTFLEQIDVDWSAITSKLEAILPSFMGDMASRIPELISSSLGTIVDLFLGLVFAVYILAQKEHLKQQTIRIIHVWLPQKIGNICIHVATVCTESFRNFIVGQTTEAIILGGLCTLGMAILQLPYASTLGVLVGVTAFIPYIGAYIGGIIGFIMILTINPIKAIIFVIFLVVLQQIEGNIIYPKVVGNRINLPSIWVLAALTIGGNLAGPIGMIMSVPAFSALYKLFQEATIYKENSSET